MRKAIRSLWLLLAAPTLLLADDVDYSRDVKPLLARHCAGCHGPARQQSGLRVDTGQALRTGGDSGPAVIVGDAPRSLLIHAVTGTEGASKMPPEGPGLATAEVDMLRRWIQMGARFPSTEVAEPAIRPRTEHWAFQPVRIMVATPRPDWNGLNSPLDVFVREKLLEAGLTPSPLADRPTRARRAALDLCGVPPTPEDIQDFLDDPRPDAYERWIDRLLASPHFGERWARDWLDIARYADSNGFTRDMPRTIWKYRDWVIAAFNANQPFDEFVLDQLAGDLRPEPTLDQRVATGFHRNTLINEEGGTDPEQFRVEAVVDRVNTTGTVFLGLTVGCAQCHDHKYDPISQRDYFQLFAYFNSTVFLGNDPAAPRIDVPSPDQIARGEPERQRRIREQIAVLNEELRTQAESIDALRADWEQTLTDADKKALPFHVKNAVDLPPRDRSATHHRDLDAYFRSLKIARDAFPQLETIATLRASEPQFPTTMVTQELPEPRVTTILLRGDFLRRGATVVPALPAALSSATDAPPRNRLELARWLVSNDNPLTARVTVNRFWVKLFGLGIVETENDFGTQGTLPTHPKLLDWLAREFAGPVPSGRRTWDVKHALRQIVTSATYQQASLHRPETAAIDPTNRWLARQNRLRLDAEVIRDSALAAAGLLTEELGGPPVYPPQPDGVFDFTQDKKPWTTASDRQRFRKALYTHLWRSSLFPALTVFDFPDANVTCTRRIRSNTPLQSLTLANDVTFVEFARGLALRLRREATEDSARLERAVRLCLGRDLESAERARMLAFVALQRARFESDPESAATFAGTRDQAVEQATWTAIARVLMNLDEFITRE